MKNNKLKLNLYLIADKLKLILYLIAVLLIITPIFIVLVTDKGFNQFYSKIFISMAFTFIIIGRILTALKKTLEDSTIPWSIISSIIGLLIALIWGIIKY
jgi:fucose permease